jgi:ribosomal-protein-alanine N-acetyltransferase
MSDTIGRARPAVALRRATSEDAPVLIAIRTEPSASTFQPLRAYTEDQLRALLERRANLLLDHSLDGKVQWVILADDEAVGWITLDVTSREHAVASVGYTIGERFRGQGVATAALRLLVPMAFGEVALERLEAVAATANVASRRVLEHAGFHHEGTARGLLRIRGRRVDHERYALLRSDVRNDTDDG